MTDVVFGVLAVAGVCAALWRLSRTSPPGLLWTTPRSDIAQVEVGRPAKVVGALRCVGAPLVAPLSGRPCACYRVRVDRQLEDGFWTTLFVATQRTEFCVEDSSGKIIVGPKGLNAALEEDVFLESGYLGGARSRAHKLLKAHGRDPALLDESPMRFYEGTLGTGSQVAVYGVGAFEARGSGDYRSRGRIMRFGKPESGPLLVSNSPDVLEGRTAVD